MRLQHAQKPFGNVCIMNKMYLCANFIYNIRFSTGEDVYLLYENLANTKQKLRCVSQDELSDRAQGTQISGAMNDETMTN